MERSNKFKIAFFLDNHKTLGGAGNLLLQQAELMSKSHEVVVVIPTSGEKDYKHEYVNRCNKKQLSYVCMEYTTAYNFTMILMDDFESMMKSAAQIEEFAKRENICFFHSVQLNLAVEYVSRKLKIPHLMSSFQISEEEFEMCLGNVFAQYHLCDSVLYSERWSRKLGIRSKCVRPVAPLKHCRKKEMYPSEGLELLMLGNVCSRKNQMTAIKAVEQCLKTVDIRLRIVGSAENMYAEQCKSYVQEHALGKYIFFYGFISDVTVYLEKADCLLCSSTDESFPFSMVEALTYDLTIITTPVAGVPELFKDKVNAFLSRDYTEDSIKTSILECMEYYKNGKIYGIHENARHTWLKHFEQGVIREQIEEYYSEIMKDPRIGDVQLFWDISDEVKQIEILLSDIIDSGEQWIRKRCLYYSFLRKNLKEGYVYIWGAGKWGRLTLDIMKRICPNIQIVAFIDTYKKGIYCEKPVIKPEDISFESNYFYCISFYENRDMVISYLEGQGLVLNRQIWCMP